MPRCLGFILSKLFSPYENTFNLQVCWEGDQPWFYCSLTHLRRQLEPLGTSHLNACPIVASLFMTGTFMCWQHLHLKTTYKCLMNIVYHDYIELCVSPWPTHEQCIKRTVCNYTARSIIHGAWSMLPDPRTWLRWLWLHLRTVYKSLMNNIYHDYVELCVSPWPAHELRITRTVCNYAARSKNIIGCRECLNMATPKTMVQSIPYSGFLYDYPFMTTTSFIYYGNLLLGLFIQHIGTYD